MPIETDFDPRYVDLDDVPISGPDVNVSIGDKRKAVFEAETALELDVNGGQEIEADEVTRAHTLAVLNLATHVLGAGAADPSSPTLGDMADDDSTRDYAEQYLEKYNEYVDKILEVDQDADGDHSFASTGGGQSFDYASRSEDHGL